MKEKGGPFKPDPEEEKAFRLAYLVAGFIRNTLTDAENTELDDWVTASMANQRLFEQLIDENSIDDGLKQFDKFDTEAALLKIKNKISFVPGTKKSRVRSIWPYAAAAALIVGLMITLLHIRSLSPKITSMVQSPPGDIAPGADRATLTLSDGKIISLDSVGNGKLTAQGSAHITKLDSGQLAYQLLHPSNLPQVESYNILTVPAGGQYKVILADGTRVWLNASSALKYPTVFGGAKRVVELTGEGYFEVAKDPMFPFEVKAAGTIVHVLGTHFNVNAYADEPGVKVVVAEGSVKCNDYMVLKPGEEVVVNHNGNMLKRKTDLEAALAWKDGQFLFKEASIEEVMRQIGRWYNAAVVYDGDIKDHFTANIARDVPVSKLLHLLEATKAVHFQIDNRQINVMK